MATVRSARGAQAAKLLALQAQREEIVCELDRINREIAEAQRQLNQKDLSLSVFPQQAKRAAA